jgi:hypothetical protein
MLDVNSHIGHNFKKWQCKQKYTLLNDLCTSIYILYHKSKSYHSLLIYVFELYYYTSDINLKKYLY